jgi:hypothetical protein
MEKSMVKKFCWLLAAMPLLIIIPITSAAPSSQLVSEFKLKDDKSANPVSYTFLAEPASGTLKFHEFYSPDGADAHITVYVQSNAGPTEVQLKFDRQFVTAYYPQNGNVILQVDKKTLNCCSLLTLAIGDGKLTVTIGTQSGTVDNITAFSGSLTSQSITSKATIYK